MRIKSYRCVANYLDPAWKGIHLRKLNKLEATKSFIVDKWESSGDFTDPVAGEIDLPRGRSTATPGRARSLSPTSRLLQEAIAPDEETDCSPLKKEFKKYESCERISADGSRIQFWKKHEEELPTLASIAKEILSIPCSSSKSERVFSTSGQVPKCLYQRIIKSVHLFSIKCLIL